MPLNWIILYLRIFPNTQNRINVQVKNDFIGLWNPENIADNIGLYSVSTLKTFHVEKRKTKKTMIDETPPKVDVTYNVQFIIFFITEYENFLTHSRKSFFSGFMEFV